MRIVLRLIAVIYPIVLFASSGAHAQGIPAEYAAFMAALAKKGDFVDGVLKVNIPRADLAVTIGGRPAPTPFGFGGWVALARGDGGLDVMMGDLVLTEAEVNPVMSALLENGLDVTALHNHSSPSSPGFSTCTCTGWEPRRSSRAS